jgi:hypothetical protein
MPFYSQESAYSARDREIVGNTWCGAWRGRVAKSSPWATDCVGRLKPKPWIEEARRVSGSFSDRDFVTGQYG